jgi:ABC-type nickel/cobalt efflux system permease component RcnA
VSGQRARVSVGVIVGFSVQVGEWVNWVIVWTRTHAHAQAHTHTHTRTHTHTHTHAHAHAHTHTHTHTHTTVYQHGGVRGMARMTSAAATLHRALLTDSATVTSRQLIGILPLPPPALLQVVCVHVVQAFL